MSNKDMPAYPADELPGMWDASDLSGGEADSAEDAKGNYQNRCCVCGEMFMGQKHDRVCGLHTEYHKCERECTAFCQCINDAHKAALAELEGRDG